MKLFNGQSDSLMFCVILAVWTTMTLEVLDTYHSSSCFKTFWEAFSLKTIYHILFFHSFQDHHLVKTPHLADEIICTK